LDEQTPVRTTIQHLIVVAGDARRALRERPRPDANRLSSSAKPAVSCASSVSARAAMATTRSRSSSPTAPVAADFAYFDPEAVADAFRKRPL